MQLYARSIYPAPSIRHTRQGTGRSTRSLLGYAVSLSLIAVVCASCGSTATSRSKQRTGIPLTDARSPTLPIADRIDAMNKAWSSMLSGELERPNTRDALVSIAMAHNNDEMLRFEALRLLFSDAAENAQAVSERLAIDMLPHEPNAKVVKLLGGTAVDRNWQATVPSFVRSYARPSMVFQDSDRPERQVLQLLRPESSVEHTVFDVFVNPPDRPEVPGIDWKERTRADAWALLTRLDRDGSMRASILAAPETQESSRTGDGVLDALRSCWNDLGCVPVTAPELAWLFSLKDPAPINTRWWTQASSAIAGINDERRTSLKLYHAEPLRWTSRVQVARMDRSKTNLVSELRTRIDARSTYRRSQREDASAIPADDRLSTHQHTLSWADVITLLAIDDALHDTGSADLRDAVFRDAEFDHSDQTTEYGGLIRPSANEPDRNVWVMFPPRPAQRRGDDVFVASADMIQSADHAIAHAHFHVQNWSNRGYAGPSAGDINYASRHGRVCVVFTGISRDELDADVYFPSGEVVDLGSIRRRN